MINSAKVLPVLCALLLCAACASMGPPRPPSLELPKPPTDLKATRKGDRVTLTWTIPTMTTDRQRMRSVGPTRICRAVEPALKECGTPVGEAPSASGTLPAEHESRIQSATTKSEKKNAAQEMYTNTLPAELERTNASGWVTYAIEVLGPDSRGGGLSNEVRVPSMPEVLRIENFDAQITAQGVRVSWALAPLPNRLQDARCMLRIYRALSEAAGSGTTQEKVADLDLPHCLGSDQQTSSAGEAATHPTSYLDQHFEWEKTYQYHGTVVTLIAEAGKPEFEFEGDDTPQVTVFAHDVFPPAVPTGLQAVFSGPGQQTFIDLIWAPVMDMDLDGYNVYRREQGSEPVKLNTELVKTPAFRDTNVVAGKTYFYSVSAVDARGNESARSEETSETVP
jgi:hypothetical protein